MKIPFFDYKKLYLNNKSKLDKIFSKVSSRGAFILQKDLEDFEHSLSKFLNIKYAVGTNDGTNALIIGLLANNIKPDDEVILPSHTYIATAAAVKLVGGKTSFC